MTRAIIFSEISLTFSVIVYLPIQVFLDAFFAFVIFDMSIIESSLKEK